MPLYEYECEVCGHRFEVIQKLSDALIATCPACGGAVHKLQSAPAFQFKGTGWYITDYARKDASGSSKAGAGSGESAKDGAKSDKPSESTAKTETSSTSSTSSPPSAPAKPSS